MWTLLLIQIVFVVVMAIWRLNLMSFEQIVAELDRDKSGRKRKSGKHEANTPLGDEEEARMLSIAMRLKQNSKKQQQRRKQREGSKPPARGY